MFFHLASNGQSLFPSGTNNLISFPSLCQTVFASIERTASSFCFVYFDLIVRLYPWRRVNVTSHIPSLFDFGNRIGNISSDCHMLHPYLCMGVCSKRKRDIFLRIFKVDDCSWNAHVLRNSVDYSGSIPFIIFFSESTMKLHTKNKIQIKTYFSRKFVLFFLASFRFYVDVIERCYSVFMTLWENEAL